MHISKSKSACSMASRWRRLIMASSEEVVIGAASHRESHSHAAQATGGDTTGQSGSNHSPKTVAEERSFKNMFMRRPQPKPPSPSATSQSRQISTASSSPKTKSSTSKRPDRKALVRPYPQITRMKNINPFVLSANGQDLRRFLEQVGTDPKEARYWLQQFQQPNDSDIPFAIVQVDNEVLDCPDMMESLGSCLSFLQRNDMKCVVVHGCAVPTNPEELPVDLQVVRTQLSADSMMLVSALENQATPARPFFSGNGILHATETIQDGTIGSNVGTVTDVDITAVKWALSSGHIPVLQCVGETVDDETGGGRILLLDVGEVTARLATALQPRKVLFVNTHGGFVDGRGEPIPNVNLPTHWDRAPTTEEQWSDDVQSRIQYIGNLLSKLPEESSVVITSAASLLTELFTHHGSGTFFRITEPILIYKSLKKVNLDRLRLLFKNSFGKDLNDDYFKELENNLHTLYLSKDYNAAAVVVQEQGCGIPPYLDKFAVSHAKQGEGTGEMLWECLRTHFPQLYWRSKLTNRINPWYFKNCEGTWSNGGEFMVFWYGIAEHKDTSPLIDHALSLPNSFKEQTDKDGPSVTSHH